MHDAISMEKLKTEANTFFIELTISYTLLDVLY